MAGARGRVNMRPWRTWWAVALLAGQALAVSRAPPPEMSERLRLYPAGTHVLIIGQSAYADPAWPALHGERDAQRIQEMFLERGVPASAITMVLPTPGSKPSLEEIVIRFGEQLSATEAADSRVVVYIAGHGFTEDGVGYLVPPDAPNPRTAPAAFKLAALPVTTLLARISAFHASHVLLILDSCFSGLALHSLPRERFVTPPSGPESGRRVLQVITAGSAGQVVADDGQFAQLVVSGLVGAADLKLDGWISGTELGMYLRMRMTEISGGRQIPTFGNIILGDELAEGENWFASAQLPLQSAALPSSNSDRLFRDCDECPGLRVVPVPGVAGGSGDSYLAMGVHEVSFDEYDACFRAGGCTHWAWSASGNRGAYPVTDVSRDDAERYTRWLSCLTNGKYRLPLDAEWMAVAEPEVARLRRSLRGGTPIANCRGCGSPTLESSSKPVGSFTPSELGLYDLIGNVWEWMADCGVNADAACKLGLVRGGGYTTRVSVAGKLPSGRVPADQRDRNIGFRVARELEGASPSALRLCSAPQAP